jgi:hypothetical protein
MGGARRTDGRYRWCVTCMGEVRNAYKILENLKVKMGGARSTHGV